MGKKKDLTGRKFGRLLVINEANERKHSYIQWKCYCECGNLVVVPSNKLQTGNTKSCGCLQKERAAESNKLTKTTHSLHGTKVCTAWYNIKDRCYNSNHKYYHYYGGRGIKLEERFFSDLPAFYEEVGDPPDNSDKWSIDRIDNNLGYITGNMRWATTKQQARNRGKTRKNSSGITGVGYIEVGKNTYWQAHWKDLDGASRSKRFNIQKYGYETAKELATEFRSNIIRQLNVLGAGYTETHGK